MRKKYVGINIGFVLVACAVPDRTSTTNTDRCEPHALAAEIQLASSLQL
jgi:hypothetical protein